MFELASEFQAMCEYLEMVGYKRIASALPGQTTYALEDSSIVLKSSSIRIMEACEDEDRGRHWNTLAHLEIRFIMELHQFVGFMDSMGVIPYTKMLGKIADQCGLSDKRALYHIREALKKTAHEIS